MNSLTVPPHDHNDLPTAPPLPSVDELIRQCPTFSALRNKVIDDLQQDYVWGRVRVSDNRVNLFDSEAGFYSDWAFLFYWNS
jgi:hypothetical protein